MAVGILGVTLTQSVTACVAVKTKECSDFKISRFNPLHHTQPFSFSFTITSPSPPSPSTSEFEPGQTNTGISTVESPTQTLSTVEGSIQTQLTQSVVSQTENTSQGTVTLGLGNTVNASKNTIVPSGTQFRSSTITQASHSMTTTDRGQKSSAVSVNSAPSAVASQRPATTNGITAKKHVNAGVLAGAVVGSFIAFLLAGVLLYVIRRRFRNSKTESASEDVPSYPLPGRWSVISSEIDSGTSVLNDSGTYVSNTIYQPETLDQKLSTTSGYPQSVLKDSEGFGYGYGYGLGISDPQKGLSL